MTDDRHERFHEASVSLETAETAEMDETQSSTGPLGSLLLSIDASVSADLVPSPLSRIRPSHG
jgi:hypothetical protein